MGRRDAIWGRCGLAAVWALAACSFRVDAGTSDGAPPDLAVVVCDGNQCRLRLDTAAELADAVAMIDIAVEADVASPADPARAVLTPAAYVRGAVIARGAAAAHGSAGTGIDWIAIATATVTGTSFAGTELAPSSRPPSGVGITSSGPWTYWIEGELALPPGTSTLRLDGDDIAALQLAAPNTRTFGDVVSVTAPGSQAATFDAGSGGWFPFRAAVIRSDGDAALRLQLASPAGSTLAPIPRARVRGRVEDLRGAFVVAWDDRHRAGPATASLYPHALLADQIDQPLAPGLTGPDDLTQRWFGQLHAEVAGSYQLSTASDDGHRVFLADQASPDVFDNVGSNITSTVNATLRRGWNDLVIDYVEFAGDEHIALTLTGAPAGVPTGMPIPRSHLRPVMPRRNAFVTHHDPTVIAIPNNSATGIDLVFSPDVLGGEVVREVRLAYEISHGMLTELDVNLLHDGKTSVLRNNIASTNRWHRPTMFDGGPLAGDWTLHIDDESGAMTGSLQSWSLTVLTEGGPGQIADRAEWISTVKDLGALGTVRAIDSFEAGLALPPGATAELHLRTCDAPTGCDAEAWSGPYASGQPVTVVARRYVQLRVVLTSNGVDEPTVDYLELSYQVDPR